MSARIGIIGASGFTGAELLRLCAGHPGLEVAFATGDSMAGTPIGALYPSLAAAYPGRSFDTYRPERLAEVDGVFLGLPHGASMGLMAEIVEHDVAVVDLGADFRLPDAALYERWYGEPHTAPGLLSRFHFGLPELFRSELQAAVAAGERLIANPGCYPTAASLALVPLVRAGLVDPMHLIVDAASGVSGAGRPPKPNTTFCTVDEDFTAYGLLHHRHTAEMELTTGGRVLFTPHLAPMNRGILATCYARPLDGVDPSTEVLLDCLHTAYAGEPFVVVGEQSPSTKATSGSNVAHLTARWDARTGSVLVIAAIDNLVKGASGQALQNMNIALGLEETAGLPTVGVYP